MKGVQGVRKSEHQSWLAKGLGLGLVPHPLYRPDLAPCVMYRYKTIEEMKEAVTKVIETLSQEHFHWAVQKLLERYNKCIAAGRDYFEGR